MKNLSKIFMSLLFLSCILLSCSKEENNQNLKQITDEQSDAMADGAALGLRGVNFFDLPITVTFTSEFQRDSIIESVVKEIYKIELRTWQNASNEQVSEEFSANVIINEGLGIIQIGGNPMSEVIIPTNPVSNGDDADCGGKAGDGWKSFGTCTNQDCTETKSKEAAAELKKGLSSGKCLDIRIKRNLLNARVCARIVNCD